MNRASLSALLLGSGLVAAAAVSPAEAWSLPAEASPPDQAEVVDVPGHAVPIAGRGVSGYSGDGGVAVEARLNDRLRVSLAPDGTVYVADRMNKRVRVVTPDGVIDTLEGTRARRSPENDGAEVPGFGTFSPSNAPIATAVGPDGSVYVASTDDVRRVEPDGTVTVLAGAGEERIDDGDPDGGPAVDAWLHKPNDIAVDAEGNVYVADTNHDRIRRIGTDGVITTVAGGGEDHPASAEGRHGSKLKTYSPQFVEVDSEGSVYFTLELDGSVFQIQPDGTLLVIEGEKIAFRGEGEEPTDAARTGGRRIAVDDDDNLYVADLGNGQLRMVEDNMITTVGPLPSTAQDIAVGADGDVYYTSQSQVWRLPGSAAALPTEEPVEPGSSPWEDREPGDVVVVAGVGTGSGESPTQVLPTDPEAGPQSVAAGPDGVTYVADTRRHVIHQVDSDGTVSTFAGTGEAGFAGDGRPATTAQLYHPSGLDVDAEGNVYVADASNARIRRIGTDGVITTVVGAEQSDGDDEVAPACAGEPATEATLRYPVDVAVGADGSIYVADPTPGLVCRAAPDGTLTAVAGGGSLWADDADDEPAVEASLWEPSTIDVDAEDNVYIIERGRPHVRMVRPDGTLVAVAGDSYYGQDEGGFAGDGGPGVEAELNTPQDLAAAPDGSVYIADTFNSRIRRIDGDGIITTIAGTGSPHDTGDGGPASDAEVNEPNAVDVSPDGSVVLGGSAGDLVRRIDADGDIETLADFGGDDAADEALSETELWPNATITVGPDATLVIGEAAALRLRVSDDDVLTALPVDQHQLAQTGRLASGPGGELYAIVGQTVARVYPDGRVVPVAGGGVSDEQVIDGALATTQKLAPVDIAVNSIGWLYVLDQVQKVVYEVRHDGTIHVADGFDAVSFAQPRGLTVGPDDTVYVTDTAANTVYAAASGSPAEQFAGTGDDAVSDGENGDNGPATDAVVVSPEAISVDAEGNVFVGASDGIRRIDPDGTITTTLPRDTDEDGTSVWPAELAIGPGDDLYVMDSANRQVLAVVRPGEMAGPFPWAQLGLSAGGVLVLGAAAVLLVRRRRRGSSASPEAALTQSSG